MMPLFVLGIPLLPWVSIVSVTVVIAFVSWNFSHWWKLPRLRRRPRMVLHVALCVVRSFGIAAALLAVTGPGAATLLAAAGRAPVIAEARAALRAAGAPLATVIVVLAVMVSVGLWLAHAVFVRRGLMNRYGELICGGVGRSDCIILALHRAVAGVVLEQVVYRIFWPIVFLGWGTGVWLALGLSLLIGAGARLVVPYLGPANAASVLVFGCVATLLFLMTEQLWPGIVVSVATQLMVWCVFPEFQAARELRAVRAALAMAS